MAENAGGAIKWEDIEPLFSNETFYSNNSALLYGDNISSFPQMLTNISQQQYT